MLVIHIGTHKTGTSALQKSLTHKSAVLLTSGIRYLESGRESRIAHHALAHAFRKVGDISVWQRLRQELDESNSRINLLSSEAFWFTDPEKVKEQLPNVDDVQIVMYLRRQDKYLQSLYKQSVAGGRSMNFAAWREQMQQRRGDYLPIVERWAAQFGAEAIVIRPYERGGQAIDVIEDFSGVIGCDIATPDEKGKVRGNGSPRRELLHFIRAVNRLDLKIDRNKFFFSLVHRDTKYVRSADLLSYDECAALMQEFFAQNRLLAEKYYRNDAEPLFPELSPDGPAPVIWGLDDSPFFDLTADVLDVIVGLASEGKLAPKNAKSKEDDVESTTRKARRRGRKKSSIARRANVPVSEDTE